LSEKEPEHGDREKPGWRLGPGAPQLWGTALLQGPHSLLERDHRGRGRGARIQHADAAGGGPRGGRGTGGGGAFHAPLKAKTLGSRSCSRVEKPPRSALA